ncbi:late competence development ComFB family protein [Clostridium sp. KNHs216]|uniref:late competence development ComFB family protein n=1 Tax=Eubacteriales TaxID=186802 RepID=UPI00114FAD6A|nr:late competence development ComFB family protein [Clostridium sp. KNHs216]TQI66534.1 late competence development protein ComFB [Clostridium sp. KNHs216]
MARTKKDIDKDLMYKMLMPSGSRTAKASQDAESPSGLSDEQNTRAALEEPLNQHKTIMRREVGVAFMDTQPTILVNTMESIVLEKLESALARFQCCKCDRCKKDIVAMALNKLPPKYMVLQEGQPTPDIDPQTNAQVVTAVIQAILAVRAHPRH